MGYVEVFWHRHHRKNSGSCTLNRGWVTDLSDYPFTNACFLRRVYKQSDQPTIILFARDAKKGMHTAAWCTIPLRHTHRLSVLCFHGFPYGFLADRTCSIKGRAIDHWGVDWFIYRDKKYSTIFKKGIKRTGSE